MSATEDDETREFTPIETCERIVAGFGGPSLAYDATIPCYRPVADEVHMPAQNRFISDEEYYSVLFHELTHSTGHGSRLARKGITDLVAGRAVNSASRIDYADTLATMPRHLRPIAELLTGGWKRSAIAKRLSTSPSTITRRCDELEVWLRERLGRDGAA